MMLRTLELLRCIKSNHKLELDVIKSKNDECIEGFLYCDCSMYPIIDGIAIIIDDLKEYFAARRGILGYLIMNSDGKMREYMKSIARSLPKMVDNDRYEQNAFRFYRYIDHSFYDTIVDIIIDNIDDNYLEVGCGYGIVTNRVGEHVDIAIGIDRSFNMVKKARENSNAEFVVADILALPFKDFDIASINTLDLFEPDLFIKALKRSIRNTLILVDPYDFRDENGDPLNNYDGRTIRSILEKHGFEIDSNTVEEQYLQWRLKISNRAYMLYLADLIIARLV